MRRVVVSGIGLLSPLGNSLNESLARIKNNESAISYISEWDEVPGLRTRLGARLSGLSIPDSIDRKMQRRMGRASLLATITAETALEEANLLGDPLLGSGRVGVAYGSGTPSTQALSEMTRFIESGSRRGINSTTYHRMMSHTCAANLGIFFGLQGRLLPTSTACTSGSLAIGLAAEQIRSGAQDVMIAGGAEEFSECIAVIFDVLFACSHSNEFAESFPKPFDQNRDGLVVAEAACTFVLEELEHAKARGIKPIAELLGFGTNSDGYHVTHPREQTVVRAMELALEDAGMESSDIGYINAHATGTSAGDQVESIATSKVFGPSIPVSSLKGHIGHALGGSGSTEAALIIGMMNQGWIPPTRNLETIDPGCGELDYVVGSPRDFDGPVIMSNTFAFGGVNTSLIFKKYDDK